MKILNKLPLALLLLALWLAPAHPALAKGLSEDKVVFGGSYVLQSGETLQGNLVVFGGAAVVQNAARVNGNIALIGGTLEVAGTGNGDVAVVGGLLTLSGTVTGDLVLVGGSAQLTSTAVIDGNVTTAGGTLDKADGAVIKGQVENSPSPSLTLVPPLLPLLPSLMPSVPAAPSSPAFSTGFGILGAIFTVLSESLLLALLAALVALFMPNHTRRVATAVAEQPLTAGGVGCLTLLILLVAVVLLTALMVTIIFIPVSVALIGFGSLAFVAALLFGTIALGFETGDRLAGAFHSEWPMPLSAFVGTLLLSLAVNAISTVFACFGWWAPFAVILLALGGVVMTRFGSRAALPPMAPVSAPILPAPSGPAQPAPPAAAAPPAPPAPPEPEAPAEPAPAPEAEKPKPRKRSGTSS
jgi:hypothetical protein